MAHVITIANQKGGVGKTATANALADGLRRKGFSVLMLDADPQCNTTNLYKAQVEGNATLYDVMQLECSAKDAIQKTEYGEIIACDPQLTKADSLFLDFGREYILVESMTPILNDYEYIIIDTLPSLGILLFNALTAANGIVIPISLDSDSIHGLSNLIKTINSVKKHANQSIKVYGLLVTMLFQNTRLSKDIISEALPSIEEKTGIKIFKNKIRYTTKVKEAKAQKQSLFEYAPNATASIDYGAWIDEFLKIDKG